MNTSRPAGRTVHRRRPPGVAVGSITFLVLAVVAGHGSALGQDQGGWPSLQGGPAHLGAVEAPRIRIPLEVAWRTDPSMGGLSMPVLTGELAVAVGLESVVGLDPESGAVRWTVGRASGPPDPPAVDPSAGRGGVLVFTEGDEERDAGIVGLDLSTRQTLWRVPLRDPARGAPAIDGGHAFVGTSDGTVTAVEVDSGRIAWRHETEAPVVTAPAVARGLVFAVSENRSSGATRVYALQEESGRTAWTFQPSGYTARASSPTVADGTVFVGFGDGRVRAFDADRGTLRWSGPVRSVFSPLSSPAYAKGDLMLQDRNGGVYRLDGETGRHLWDYQFPSAATRGAPLVVGGHVLVGLDDGTVAAIDIGTGNLVWSTRIGAGEIGAFSPAGGLLLAPAVGSGGGIVAFKFDPAGTLVDEPSPTRLNLPVALANFALAFVILLAVLLGLFRLLVRKRARPATPEGPMRTDRSEE